MKIITAIENKKINEKLKKINKIEILNSDIQYKEGILEYLEKNKNIDLIIFKENLPGQINLIELINEINKINNKIKIIIFINNNFEKNKKLKNVKYIYLEKITIENILKILNNEKQNLKENINKNLKIIKIFGNSGAGKTTISAILIKIVSQIKKQKVLLIDEDKNKILSKIFLKNININNVKEKEIINIDNKIYLLNSNYLINNKISILEYLRKIKNEFNYIIIDSKNNNYNIFEKLTNKKFYLLEANFIELEKAKKNINNNIEIIINKKNINSIDKNVFEKIFNKKVFLEIDYNKKFNLFINNNFDLKYLNKKLIYKFLRVIN